MTAPLAVQQHEVLIVGGGFGGIGMAVMLERAGVDDFLILERGPDVGGVWRDNTYPGAAAPANTGWAGTCAAMPKSPKLLSTRQPACGACACAMAPNSPRAF